MPSTEKSARRAMVEELVNLWRRVRGAGYYVKRGPVYWANHDFAKRPRAVSILLNAGSFLRERNEVNVSFEIASRWELDPADPQMDEGLQDDMLDDAKWVLQELAGATDENGDSVVLQARKDDKFQEFSDPDVRVQGVVVFVDITY